MPTLTVSFGDQTTTPQQRLDAQPRLVAALERHKAKVERSATRRGLTATFTSTVVFADRAAVAVASLDWTEA
jgi:hypothetical protein